jgi:hypothetical protein
MGWACGTHVEEHEMRGLDGRPEGKMTGLGIEERVVLKLILTKCHGVCVCVCVGGGGGAGAELD